MRHHIPIPQFPGVTRLRSLILSNIRLPRRPGGASGKRASGIQSTHSTSVANTGCPVSRSVLSIRQVDGDAVEFVSDFDLASQAARFVDVEREIQNRLLEFFRFSALVFPFRRNVDMTGPAGAQPATIAFDTGHHVRDGGLHHRGALGDLHFVLRTIVFDKQNFRHATPRT